MKIVLVYLVKGEAREYQRDLIEKLAKISGENYLTEINPIPQHFTLKSPFETEDLEKLEKVIEDFVATQKKSWINIKEFGNFRRFVIFLKPELSRESFTIQKEFIGFLQDRLDLKMHEHDLNWSPHATLAYGNTEESFDMMWNYLQKLEKPNFKLEFDNIAILKRVDKKWKIHKEFNIK